MPNSTIQDLLNQYTSKIKVDPRVFSQDVMSQDQFARPFDAWVNNMVNQYMVPEFTRYTYNPRMRELNAGLYNLNQDIGLSGAWRNTGSQAAMQDAANAAIRDQEQMTRGFNDQVLETQDAFKRAWSDPLYKSRMTQFYNAPWRNIDTGGNVGASLTPTDPRLQGFVPNNASGQGGYTGGSVTPFTGSDLSGGYGMGFGGGMGQMKLGVMPGPGKSNPGMPSIRPVRPPQVATVIGGNQRDLLSRYLKAPTVTNANSFNILANS